MKNTRLKYHVTDDCLKRLSEEYIDSNASLDLEDICSTKGKNTFFVAEKSPEMQNPMTLFTMEKHHCCPEKFYHKVGCSTEPASGTLTGVVG